MGPFLGPCWGPFWGPFWPHVVYFGAPKPKHCFWSLFAPFMTHFEVPFGVHVEANLGQFRGSKTRANFISCLIPFWDQFWHHFGVQFAIILVSFWPLAGNPGDASPGDDFRLPSETTGIPKSLENYWFLYDFGDANGSRVGTRNLSGMPPKGLQNGAKHVPNMATERV